MATFAEKLRVRAAILNISQSELARRTGLTQPTISNLWNGKHEPSFSTASKLADALGCTLEELRPDSDDQEEEAA